MRIVTFALVRAQEDPEKAAKYPKSYFGTWLNDDGTHIWMRVGRMPTKKNDPGTRRTIAIPKTSIVKITTP